MRLASSQTEDVTMQTHATEIFLNSRQLKERFGPASDMWLWRRLHENKGFPQPVRIGSRRFWRLSELLAYEQSLATAA